MIERAPALDIPGIKLLEKVGEGGTSAVWKGFDIENNRVVAVKILHKRLCTDPEEVQSFRAEEKLMEEIHHPGIVEGYRFDIDNGNWFVVMEYIDGYSFADLLQRKGHIGESDCILILESVASALDFIWNRHGLVHCDIKPDNIMINTQGLIKLTDLGIAHKFQYLEGGVQEIPEHVVGTPAYISPEQVYGDVELDCRTDIYSLGATIYHLATGRMLFPGLDADAMMRAHCDDSKQAKDPRFYRPELSVGFCQILEVMLIKNRLDRIHDWKLVYEMCQEVENGNCFKPRETAGVSSFKLRN